MWLCDREWVWLCGHDVWVFAIMIVWVWFWDHDGVGVALGS